MGMYEKGGKTGEGGAVEGQRACRILILIFVRVVGREGGKSPDHPLFEWRELEGYFKGEKSAWRATGHDSAVIHCTRRLHVLIIRRGSLNFRILDSPHALSCAHCILL